MITLKKKKSLKLLITLIMTLAYILAFNTMANASEVREYAGTNNTIKPTTQVAKSFGSGYSSLQIKMKPDTSNSETQVISKPAGLILGIIQFCSIAILLGSIIVLGITVVTNSTNGDAIAKAKQGALGLLIASILIGAPATVLKMVYNAAQV